MVQDQIHGTAGVRKLCTAAPPASSHQQKDSPYCTALMNNDKTVCDKNYNGGQGPWGFDVADFAHKFDKAGGKYDLVPRN